MVRTTWKVGCFWFLRSVPYSPVAFLRRGLPLTTREYKVLGVSIDKCLSTHPQVPATPITGALSAPYMPFLQRHLRPIGVQVISVTMVTRGSAQAIADTIKSQLLWIAFGLTFLSNSFPFKFKAQPLLNLIAKLLIIK